MKKKSVFGVWIIFLFVIGVLGLEAKKYDLFGYSDFLFLYGKQGEQTRSSFLQNRTNLILSSEFFKRWNFFFNMEFNGAVEIQSEQNAGFANTGTKGTLQLEEGWTSYTLSDLLVIKAGVFLAPFGSFNVIQDMSPTYISVRPPMIYDDDFRNRNPVHIIPERCNLEISGKIVKHKTKLEYYLYTGNGLGTDSQSVDANLSKAIGARLVFVHDENLKIGLSTYFDKAEFSFTPPPPVEGSDTEVPKATYWEKRDLYSIDWDYTFSRFNLNGEYFYNHNRPSLFDEFNRVFYYLNINMELVNQLRCYVERDYYKDHVPRQDVKEHLGRGVYKTIFGLNFKPNWRTALKGEIQFYSFKNDVNPSFAVFMASLSVLF